jgi:hypothetical protein
LTSWTCRRPWSRCFIAPETGWARSRDQGPSWLSPSGWAATTASGRHGVLSATGSWDDWHDDPEPAVALMRRSDTPSGTKPRGLRRRANRWAWLVLAGVVVIAGVVVLTASLSGTWGSQGPGRHLCTRPISPAPGSHPPYYCLTGTLPAGSPTTVTLPVGPAGSVPAFPTTSSEAATPAS